MKPRNYKFLLLILLYVALISIWISGFNYHEFFRNKDNMDYAQMGRELVRGHGFSTIQLFPGHLKYLKEKDLLDKKDIPNLYRFPLPTISNALFQLFVKDPVNASIIQSGFWMLVTIPIIFLIIFRLSEVLFGVLGSLFFFFDNLIISYSGMGETLTTFFMVLLFYLILKKRSGFFLQGIVLGFLFLSRTIFLFVLPVLIIFYITERVGIKKVLIFFSGFLIISAGWFIRNYSITNSPFFSFTNIRNITIPFTEERIDPFYTLEMNYSAFGSVLINKDYILEKTKTNLGKFLSLKFWSDTISVSAIFLILSIIFYFFIKDEFIKKRGSLFFLVFISSFVIYSPFLLIPRWFVPLKPLILIFFLIFLREVILVYNSKIKSSTIISYFLLSFFLLGIISSWDIECKKITKFISGGKNEKRLHSFDKLKKIVRGKVVLSDISHQIALFCDTKAIRAPIDPKEISDIDKKYLKIDYIVLTKRFHVKMRNNYKRYFIEKMYHDKFILLKQFKGIHILKRKS